jgi:hypothetical protein
MVPADGESAKGPLTNLIRRDYYENYIVIRLIDIVCTIPII